MFTYLNGKINNLTSVVSGESSIGNSNVQETTWKTIPLDAGTYAITIKIGNRTNTTEARRYIAAYLTGCDEKEIVANMDSGVANYSNTATVLVSVKTNGSVRLAYFTSNADCNLSYKITELG